MEIFSLDGTSLKRVKELPFEKEKNLQILCESNISALLGLELIRSEFSIGSFRIDTVAFDSESRAFVIIEYKRGTSFSIVDQGYAYLSTMLNNKADFILEYNENRNDTLKRKDVDWSQSRVIFVSADFTPHQRESINFRDLPIELWEIHRYANNSLVLHRITPTDEAESIQTVSGKSQTIKQVSKEVKVYTEADHYERSTPEVVEIYEALKPRIMGIAGDVELSPQKYYLAFQVGKRNFADIHLAKSFLKLWVNVRKDELHDPAEIARDVSSVGHWGNGDYEIKLTDDTDIEYVVKLIRQSYETNSENSAS